MNASTTSKVKPTVIDEKSGLGFGAMSVAAFYGEPTSNEDALKLFQAIYDAGCRHIDTAEIYKSGNPFADSPDDIYSETMLSPFLKSVPRDSYTIATKYFPMKWGNKCDYETVKQSLGNSLSRLGLDYVDLYYCHRIPSLEGAIEFAKVCNKLKTEGLIKEFGLSEIGPKWLKKVHEEAGPVGAIQQEWSMLTRNLEEELVPTCKELGVPIVAYSPLARNILACVDLKTVPNDWRATLPRFNKENLEKNSVLLSDVVGSIAKKYDCTTAQLSLGWLFKKANQLGVTVIPIPGTTKIAHALSNIGATEIDIGDEDMKVLDGVAGVVAGERGDEGYIQMGFEAQE